MNSLKIKAAVCREFKTPLALETLELAAPQKGEVRVKVKACAICHSDITYMDGNWGGTLPAVFGHEASGRVESLGPGVKGFTPGDSVIVTLIRSCGDCYFCNKGHQVNCETSFALDKKSPLSQNQESIHQGLRTGAFAEYVTVEASQLCKMPESMDFAAASLLACGAITGVGAALNTAKVPEGASTMIIGCGGVGLNTVQGCALAKARQVIAVDTQNNKLDIAKTMGATHSINPNEQDLRQELLKMTEGRGPDYLFVTVGSGALIELAFELIANTGTAIIVGMPASDVITRFDPATFANNGQKLLGSKMGSAQVQIDIPFLLKLYHEGRLQLDTLISNRYKFKEINQAILDSKRGKSLRNVILFD